ncbi:S8 family peptidase [Aridibaculum aurantiacum]|uniref:S8 family peptidase n=1 Tax=Aridibaculum aurantiacum TaxID=2810307 RepID=UPI001A96654F|nr:S8 family peptidase [Aridibaculum aurantiacum]
MLLITLFIFSGSYAQNLLPGQKIDPILKQRFSEVKADPSKAEQKFSGIYVLEPTEGFTETGRLEKRYEVIVYTKDAAALRETGIVINSVLPKFVTAWATIDQVEQLAQMKEVDFVAAPQVEFLANDVSVGQAGASLLHNGRLNNTTYKGRNVLVAIYDTGVDWKHLDFRHADDTTKSRILRIWDQTLTAQTGEAPPTGFSYGVEYTQTQINDEIDGTPTGVVRQKDTNGHGTHVAGTAAGNGAALPSRKYAGMAPESDIIVIKGGESSFNESRMIDGLTYAQNLSNTLGRPIVVNWSIGGQTGAHDGTRAYEVAVDNFTTAAPGRVVVISAGNDNGSNIHRRLNLEPGASGTIVINVPSGTAGTDVFQFSLFSNTTGDLVATGTAPSGETTVANPGDAKVEPVLGGSFNMRVTNQIYSLNGLRYVNFYITRTGSNTTNPQGTWTLEVTNTSATAVVLDGWLNYRSSSFSGTTLQNGDNELLVGSPGNAATAITVASYIGRNSWYSQPNNSGQFLSTVRMDSISPFSARGPRRDGVLKPEIAAVGQMVVSALSSDMSASASSTAVTGLYRSINGTSMAAPGVAGSAALLLQANPNATAAQIKTLLTSTATKDAMTELVGPTPNPTWGHGKLDVYKAASAMFNCLPAQRKMLQYDASTRNSEESGMTLSNHRVAVRFTPDMTGKLGGVLFHTSLTSTSLLLEIRDNNAGVPGAVLGSMIIDSVLAARYTYNYIDVSHLDVSVTNGVDYFVVLSRSPSSTAAWSLRRESIALDNRSLTSTDNTTWTNPGVDYKIRSVVYHNVQVSGPIAQNNSTDIRNINTSNLFLNNVCEAIVQIEPNGLNPVSGVVTSKVWKQPTVQLYNNEPYVQRHYEITPVTNTSTATGRVTLFFTQAEFDAFNNHPGSDLNLPTGPTDDAGKANLRVMQFPGTSNDGSGTPHSYTGTPTMIDPADGNIIWNTQANRWEVTFDVVGFSGFIVMTDETTLPIVIEHFRGISNGSVNELNWKVNCANTAATFEVERSGNGTVFHSIGTIRASQARCSQPFDHIDATPLAGKNFYRIKMTDATGKIHYTHVILLQIGKAITSTLYPTIIHPGQNVQVNFAGATGTLYITDAAGRRLHQAILTTGAQSIQLPINTPGMYFYNIVDEQNQVTTGKIVIR